MARSPTKPGPASDSTLLGDLSWAAIAGGNERGGHQGAAGEARAAGAPDALTIESFDDLVLRSSAQDWWRTMFRDGMIQTLTRHMDLDGQAYQYEVRYSTSPINEANFLSATRAGSPPTVKRKGMAQKIQFIATVVSEPDLIILDEPFTGLDPVNASVIRKEP